MSTITIQQFIIRKLQYHTRIQETTYRYYNHMRGGKFYREQIATFKGMEDPNGTG